MTNALRHYLGKPLRRDKASDVLQLIDKVKGMHYINFKINIKERDILQNALDNYLKRFTRMDSTFDVAQLIEEFRITFPSGTFSDERQTAPYLFS